MCRINLMALLGKPTGGERTIGMTPMFYRVWCRCRNEVAKWEQEHAAQQDLAKKGSCALQAAVKRLLVAEVAQLLGLHSIAAMWDMEKLFGTIDVSILVQEALEAKYPLVDLCTGLAIQTAPRVLQCGSSISQPVEVKRSILPGCKQSVALTRAPMRKLVQATDTQEVPLGIYVDDVAQQAVHRDPVHLGAAAMIATTKFARGVLAFKLRISHKSTVVDSKGIIASMAQAALRKMGVKVTVANTVRDLGLEYSAGRARKDSLQAKRVKWTGHRFG
jgi:hypothetical protein